MDNPSSSSMHPQSPPNPNPKTPSKTNLINSYHPSPSRSIYSDRFIPSRSSSNFALFDLPLSNKEDSNSSSNAYTCLLRTALFGPVVVSPVTPEKNVVGVNGRRGLKRPNCNIFRYKTETRQRLDSLLPFGVDDQLPGVVSPNPVKIPRKVPKSPYKVLDAPALQDDFYLNLVDWSSQNVLAVGLGSCVYLWHASSGKVVKLCDLENDGDVSSVGWAQRGTHLAIGTSNGNVQLWDASHSKRIRTMEGHRLRVGALAWSSSQLSSGSRDKSILQRDIRAQEDYISKLSGHKSEVCGLKWSYDSRELASGGNDNRVFSHINLDDDQLFVWNNHSTQPILKYCEHIAAVKAIAWSPHLHGLLASGGGTADRCIRFWNTTTNTHLSCMDTGSQIATLTGHTYRVLYLAMSPDGQTIVTGAGDETLRFWNVFPSPKSQNTKSEIGASSLGRTQIR
ncbi:hypothetical protein RND71_005101 [Anisodus tanguticus]|uniref:CDC20/Fizzy WD40 domain-containing protein n=1 Tax=Anisodus tanguticus TaxID=243964 RepID=A0AAE1VUR4_9SOLA|nr:hypothetical protein RND71_005101 [Anisodus tanguticus]